MDQLLWMLAFLPDWFWTLILIISLVGVILSFFLKLIPFVNLYRIPIQLASILLLIVSIFFQGYYFNESFHATEKERLEKLKQEAEEKAKKATDDLVAAQGQLREEIAKKGQVSIKVVDRWLKPNSINLSDSERAEMQKQFAAMSEKEKADWQRKVDELQKMQQECKFPEIMTDELNKLTTRPVKEEKK